MDLRYDIEKVKSSWNFINKLWNASRFVLMNIEDLKSREFDYSDLTISDKWILTKKNLIIKSITSSMDKYDFHNVGNELYKFVWEDFCDWYIELSKANMNDTTKKVLLDVLTTILKLLHPFMPYVTEEIYSMLPVKEQESIMISSYPVFNKEEIFNESKEILEKVLEDIVAIRNLKATNKVTKDSLVEIKTEENLLKVYSSQLKIKQENLVNEVPSSLKSINYKSKYIDITYYFEQEEVDNNKILEEIEKLTASIERRKKLLANENYVNKAPKNIVELDREKLKEEEEKLSLLKNK